jgi:thiamine biosynthesis protein ThiS
VTNDVRAQAIAISVNGEPRQVAAQVTIHQLLSELGVSADKVAVELDRRIVSKRDWDSTRVHAGAQIEIVQFVGGG